MGQFRIGNHTYRTKDMDVMIQMKVAKKVLPLVESLKDIQGLAELKMVQQSEAEAEEHSRETGAPPVDVSMKETERRLNLLAKILSPIISAFSSLPDESAEYVFDACMAITERCEGEPKPGVMWTPVWNSAARRPMYPDIDLPKMAYVTILVINDKFASYFSDLTLSFGLGRVR